MLETHSRPSNERAALDDHYARIVSAFTQQAPVDVSGLAKALGLRVWETDNLEPGVSGKLVCSKKLGGSQPYAIVVRASDPYVRKRFTVAHEIAHFLLHRDEIADGEQIVDNDRYRSTKVGTPEEIQANRLAAEILIPEHLVNLHKNAFGANPKALARTFQVSELAMKIRLGY